MLSGRKMGVSLLALLLLVSSFMPLVDMKIVELQSNNSTVADVSVLELLPDPTLQDSPNVVVSGNSGEFSYSHDGNSVALQWSHTAGTSLDFREEVVEGLPDCLDFIYLIQEFEWSYNEPPSEVLFEFEFNTVTTGTFHTDMDSGLMFKLYVWLIDSSGNWNQIYRSYPPYTEIIQTRRGNLNYFDIQASFGGMIEDAYGVQEDPDDTLTFAVGFSPTTNFEYYPPESSEPWQDFDGTVTFDFQSLGFTAFLQTEDDPSLGISPLFNNTWSKNINDVFLLPLMAGSATDWATDVATSEDGSVYIVGKSSIPYDYWVETRQQFAFQTLLKFDPQTNLLWQRHLDNRSYGLAVCTDGVFVYTSGKIYNETGWFNTITAKYTASGQLLWKRIWDNGADEMGDSIAVAPDGTVFVCAITQNIKVPEPLSFTNSMLLKYSPAGELLSNKTLGIPYFEGMSEIRVTNTSLYLWEGSVSCRNHDGDILWSTFEPANAFTVSKDGTLYTAHETFNDDIEYIHYLKWDSLGNNTQVSNFSIVYDESYTERIQCGQIAVAPDGSLHGLLMKEIIDFGYVMVKFSSEGEQLWNKTIIGKYWGYWIPGVHLRIASSGLAYVVNYWDSDIHIDVYDIGEYSIPVSLGNPMTIVLLGGGIAIAAVIIVYWKRKQPV